MPSLEGLRHYCRTDAAPGEEETDMTLMLCYGAAIEYLYGAGVAIPEDMSEAGPLYDTAVYMLASTWYDARGAMVIGQVPNELSRTVQALVLQLRYT